MNKQESVDAVIERVRHIAQQIGADPNDVVQMSHDSVVLVFLAKIDNRPLVMERIFLNDNTLPVIDPSSQECIVEYKCDIVFLAPFSVFGVMGDGAVLCAEMNEADAAVLRRLFAQAVVSERLALRMANEQARIR